MKSAGSRCRFETSACAVIGELANGARHERGLRTSPGPRGALGSPAGNVAAPSTARVIREGIARR